LLARLGRILKWIILLPVLVVALLLAVANTQPVGVHLNPFDSADPALTVTLALYQVLFILFAAGALVGGFVVWLNQLKHRRHARRSGEEAARWQARAERVERRGDTAPAGDAAAFLPRPERG
jgi:hypothetical protein